MSLSEEKKLSVENIIKASLENKLANHSKKPEAKPFHTRLLGQDRLALYSFVQSLNTYFGTKIFEPVAEFLASDRFDVATQVSIGEEISANAQTEIQNIINNLAPKNTLSNKQHEIEVLRRVCRSGETKKVKLTAVDLLLRTDEETYLIDIKTAKPNKGQVREFKRTLLEWAAIALRENPDANINTLIAIPYNPFEPKPYKHWPVMSGMLDLDYELKVAEEFWDFLGGEGTYPDLLGCFERVGIELKDEIDEYFKRFAATQISN